MNIMEQLSRDMRESAKAALKNLDGAQVRTLMIEVLDASEDVHLMGAIQTSAHKILGHQSTP